MARMLRLPRSSIAVIVSLIVLSGAGVLIYRITSQRKTPMQVMMVPINHAGKIEFYRVAIAVTPYHQKKLYKEALKKADSLHIDGVLFVFNPPARMVNFKNVQLGLDIDVYFLNDSLEVTRYYSHLKGDAQGLARYMAVILSNRVLARRKVEKEWKEKLGKGCSDCSRPNFKGVKEFEGKKVKVFDLTQ